MKKLVSFFGKGDKAPEERRPPPSRRREVEDVWDDMVDIAKEEEDRYLTKYKVEERKRKRYKRKIKKSFPTYPHYDWLPMLGEDIFLLVLQYMKKSQLYAAMQVCKAWNGACNNPVIWRSLCIKRWNKVPPPTASPKLVYKQAKIEDRQERFLAFKQEEIQREQRMMRMDMMVCRMFHPTNGRNNFERIEPVVPMCQMPSRDELKLILAEENRLRLDPIIQDAYRQSDSPTKLTLEVQKQAVEKYGYSDPWIISSAISYYQDDSELMSIPHYVKFNRSNQGKVQCGDVIPNLPLCGLDGKVNNLHDMLAPYAGMPVILVGGSYT